jgi:hypothetical protein
MGPAGSSLFTIPGRLPLSGARPETCLTVVWLGGERDISTGGGLWLAIGGAVVLDETSSGSMSGLHD